MERLSDELLLAIMSYITPLTLARISLTSKRFNVMTHDPLLWIPFMDLTDRQRQELINSRNSGKKINTFIGPKRKNLLLTMYGSAQITPERFIKHFNVDMLIAYYPSAAERIIPKLAGVTKPDIWGLRCIKSIDCAGKFNHSILMDITTSILGENLCTATAMANNIQKGDDGIGFIATACADKLTEFINLVLNRDPAEERIDALRKKVATLLHSAEHQRKEANHHMISRLADVEAQISRIRATEFAGTYQDIKQSFLRHISDEQRAKATRDKYTERDSHMRRRIYTQCIREIKEIILEDISQDMPLHFSEITTPYAQRTQACMNRTDLY